jgi:crotonobetainyl-CoA:carnitine CoA-transferase CaiB-like acyl-CoA transferase
VVEILIANEVRVPESPPLNGVTVLDLSALLPGPYCTMLLADMGARVIKVERPGGGDPTRHMNPLVFQYANRNKESVALDLKSDDARGLLHRIVAKADVVVEGFRPGVASRLELGYEQLLARNPWLIYCSITGYGQAGPRRRLPGHDLNYQAAAGWEVSGEESVGRFAQAMPPIGDLAAGALAAAGICAALRGGGPAYLDMSIADSLVTWGATRLGSAEMAERDALYDVYDCLDGRISLGIREETFWPNLCAALGREDLLGDDRFGDIARRRANRAALRDIIAGILAGQEAAYWMNAFERHDVPAAVPADRRTLHADEQFRTRSIYSAPMDKDHPELPGSVFGWPVPAGGAPPLDEHGPALAREFGAGS